VHRARARAVPRKAVRFVDVRLPRCRRVTASARSQAHARTTHARCRRTSALDLISGLGRCWMRAAPRHLRVPLSMDGATTRTHGQIVRRRGRSAEPQVFADLAPMASSSPCCNVCSTGSITAPRAAIVDQRTGRAARRQRGRSGQRREIDASRGTARGPPSTVTVPWSASRKSEYVGEGAAHQRPRFGTELCARFQLLHHGRKGGDRVQQQPIMPGWGGRVLS